MCPCFGARRVIVGKGLGREQTVFATFGSRGACVGEDFSFAVLLFPQTFFVQLRSSPCGGGCFSGFVFFPSSFSYFMVCLFSLFIVGTLLVAQCLRFSLMPALWRATRLVGVVCWRCGVLGQWVALMDDVLFPCFVQCVALRALSGFCAFRPG